MAVLDRVKERVETDLSDAELNALIASAQSDVIDRFGAVEEITVASPGRCDRYVLDLIRPIDEAQNLVVSDGGTILDPSFYTVSNNGRTLTSSNRWGTDIEITYTPKSDLLQREEVVIELVQLAVRSEGVSRLRVGDVTTDHLDHETEREKILSRLSPRKGLFLR